MAKKVKQLLNTNGEPIAPKKEYQEDKIIMVNPEADKRGILLDKDGDTRHIIERKHGQTYQIVGCEPERFSPLMGMFIIFKEGYYHRLQPKMGKDALGRPKQVNEVAQIQCFEDKPL